MKGRESLNLRSRGVVEKGLDAPTSQAMYAVDQPASACNNTVEPVLVDIGTNWFSVNDTVSEEYRGRLWSLWEDDRTDEDVPMYLLQYVTAPGEGSGPSGDDI
ncbi:hypothetical protein APSETT444_004352 [Aspergillus pseudonomiae]